MGCCLDAGAPETFIIGAQKQMRATTELKVVEGATHLFEEQGKLEEVAKLSISWFNGYLR
jgi:hypothetical protein